MSTAMTTDRAERLLAEAKRSAATIERAGHNLRGRLGDDVMPMQWRLGRAHKRARARVDRRARLVGTQGAAKVTVLPPVLAVGSSLDLFAAAAALEAAWDALCRCVDEFEPDDMTACCERRDNVDSAIVSVSAALHGRATT